MQRIVGYFSLAVITGLVGISLGAVVGDLGMLVDSGGWFAVVGQFMAVFSTLVLGLLLAVLGVSVLMLPVFAYFLVAAPSGQRISSAGAGLYRGAERIWKVAWWIGWGVRRVVLGAPER